MNNEFYKDESQIKKELVELEQDQRKLQAVLDEFNKLNLFPVKHINELRQLINEPENWIKKQLQDQLKPTKILGIPISRSKAVDLMDLPSFENLNKVAENANLIFSLERFTLNGNKIEVAKGAKQKIIDMHTIKASNKKEEEALEAFRNIAESINKINSIDTMIITESKLKELVIFDKQNEARPNDYFFKRNKAKIIQQR